MRKFLSLVLALVMMMSLVTINAGAKEFTDGKDITYDEAVDVISTVKVVDGYANGSFNPGGNLTRGAAAKIICNLILGPTTAAELHADTAPYRDVPVSHDFAGYIAYCQKEGIISGYADGSFRPGGTLTGYAFMKMLLGALGYDAEIEQYTGPNWSINVAKRAIGIGLNKGLEKTFNGVDYITREEACLYAFNTLQADLVQYDSRITTTINGAQVTVGNSQAESRKWDSQATRVNNIRVDNIVQFAEEYFNKLEKKHGSDDFERPAYTWVYDKEEIGTYVDYDLMLDEYTTEVTGRELYDLITATALKDNELSYFVDGADADNKLPLSDIHRGNQDSVGDTGDGVLTQVFLDKDREELTITSINTYFAKVTADYNEDREDAPFDVYLSTSAPTATPKTVDLEKVPAVENVKEDDFYLVFVSYKNVTDGEVVDMAKPEVLEGSTVTKYSADKWAEGKAGERVKKLTVDGTEYKRNVMAYYKDGTLNNYNNDLLTDKTYNVYLDQYGYFIAVEEDEGAKNYVFITGFDRPTSNLSIKTADAAAIFLDGTMQEIKVNVQDTDKNIRNANPLNASNVSQTSKDGGNYFIPWDIITATAQMRNGFYALNRWFTYRVNANGVYTLTPATQMTVTRYNVTKANPVILKTNSLYVDDTVMMDDQEVNPRVQAPYYDVNGTKLAFATGSPVGGGTSTGTSYLYQPAGNRRAYGNDDSVYITVETDVVDTSLGNNYAITDVSGVYTGAQNVEIEINSSTAYYAAAPGTTSVAPTGDNPLEEAQVYTVYDDDNYIIGCVTNGEAKGGNATIAYVLSGPQSERIEDGVYYWEFDAVVEGVKQTLTVKESFAKVFNNIVKNEANELHKQLGQDWRTSGVLGDYNVLSDSVGVDGRPTTTYQNETDGIIELRFDADKKYVTSIRPVMEDDIYSQYGTAYVSGGIRTSGYTSKTDATSKITPTSPSFNFVDSVKLSDVKAYRVNGISTHALNGDLSWTETGTYGYVSGDPSKSTNYYDNAPETLKLVGRTLYVTHDQHDEGIALASDAKAVTIQYENRGWKIKEHGSVASAISQLSMPLNAAGQKTYAGEVVAAVNSTGQATWLVFTNYNELSSGTPVTPNAGRVTNLGVQYFNPNYDGSGRLTSTTLRDNDEFTGFYLEGTRRGQTYEVTMRIMLDGIEGSARTMRVAGQDGTTVVKTRADGFKGALDVNTVIILECGDMSATYKVRITDKDVPLTAPWN